MTTIWGRDENLIKGYSVPETIIPDSTLLTNIFFSSQSQMLHISENQGPKVFDYIKYTLECKTIVRDL